MSEALTSVKNKVRTGHPVGMSAATNTAFDAPDTNGYVTQRSGLRNRGNHATLIVGWIDNSALPQGAPVGSGGGYFIVRNSWGNCYGDQGHVYLPYNWVKEYAYDFISMENLASR